MHKFVFSNQKDFIDICLSCGVDQFIVDLERTGKIERQSNLNSFISNHTMLDVEALASQFGSDQMIVRIDFLSCDYLKQIDELSAMGIKNFMVPMFDTSSQIEDLLSKFDCHNFIPLVETKSAFHQIDKLVHIPAINSFHIGLNDLSLQLKTGSMFDIVTNGVLENTTRQVSLALVERWGFGGVGSSFFDHKVKPNEVLRHHKHLGSNQVILTRDFLRIYEREGADKLRSSLNRLNEEIRNVYDENH